MLLFVYLGASAVGVFLGGPIGDRFGAKFVIWFSILGVLPFTLALPYADFTWTVVLTIIIGLDLLVGLLCHRGVRAGADAGAGWDDCWHVFRLCLRSGRHRGCRTRCACRRYGHRVRVLGLLVPAAGGSAHRIPAADAGNGALTSEGTDGLLLDHHSRRGGRPRLRHRPADIVGHQPAARCLSQVWHAGTHRPCAQDNAAGVVGRPHLRQLRHFIRQVGTAGRAEELGRRPSRRASV